MQYTKTLYSWADIYNLPTGTKFTDSSGTDYWSLGEGHIIDDCASFVAYRAIELPVTLQQVLGRLQVRKLFGIPRWCVRGAGLYESFSSHAEAITWAQKMARS